MLRAHVWLVATVIPLLVRAVPLKRLLRLLNPSPRRQPYRGLTCQQIIDIVSRRVRAPRNMRRRSCLRFGLTLFHFLRLSGYPAILHFGVLPKTDSGRMQAHCWVSVPGVIPSEARSGCE